MRCYIYFIDVSLTENSDSQRFKKFLDTLKNSQNKITECNG